MVIAKVGRRGQLTLPKEIRTQFQVREGDRVAFVRRGDEILLQPIRKTLLDLKGSVPVKGKQDFGEIRKATRSLRAKRRRV